MIKDKILLSVIPPLGSFIIKFIGKSTRWEKINYERVTDFNQSDKPIIFAFWHGRLLMIPYICEGKNPHVLISQHRDGEMIARIIKYFNLKSIRGSTTRGGMEGFKNIVKVLKNGSDVVIAPDGPKGPPYIVQPGIIRLASISGCPILPIAYSVSKYKKLGSWDEFMLPAPFGKGAFIAGEPMTVPPKASKDIYEKKRIELETSLNNITETVDKKVSAITEKNRFKYQDSLSNNSKAINNNENRTSEV